MARDRQALPILGVAGLTLAGVLAVGALILRRQAHRFEGSVLSVFLSDSGTVGAVTPRFRLQGPARKS